MTRKKYFYLLIVLKQNQTC